MKRIMEVEIVGTLLLVVVFTIYITRNVLKSQLTKVKRLPGPYSFPLIGGVIQILLLGNREHNYEVMHKACQKYGKVMGFRGGIQEYIVTEDREAIKEILTSSHFTDRFPSIGLYHQHTFGGNYGLIFGAGKPWRDVRRFSMRVLGEQGFGDMRTAQEVLNIEIDALLLELNKQLQLGNGFVQVRRLFDASTLNVTLAVVAGGRVQLENKQSATLLKLAEKGSECEFVVHPIFAFPILDWIPGFSPIKKFQLMYQELYVEIRKVIAQRNVALPVHNARNLIEHFLDKIEQEKTNLDTIYIEEQLLVTVADFLAASIDTTAKTLSFAILYMVTYPNIQKRVQAELDLVLHDRNPTVFDRYRLPYTEATIWEILRLSNVLPVMTRTTTCDTIVDGYAVKTGTIAVLNTYYMNIDPNLWGDPLVFRPDRFIEQDGKIRRDNGMFIFGAGKRQCVGQTVGILTLFTFLASILQKYEISAGEGQPVPSLEPITGFSNAPRPYRANFKLRQIF